MPNTIYCQSCGFPNAYTISKPNFCGKCKSSLSTSSFAGVNKVSPNAVVIPSIPVEETEVNKINARRALSRREIEEETMEEIPEIDSFSFKIEGAEMGNHRKITLEDAIFNSPKPVETKTHKGKRMTKKSSKQAFEELMARAKSRTGSSEIGGNES